MKPECRSRIFRCGRLGHIAADNVIWESEKEAWEEEDKKERKEGRKERRNKLSNKQINSLIIIQFKNTE